MRQSLAKQIAAYWQAAGRVTFETADKEEIYALLGRADRLIGALTIDIVRMSEGAAKSNEKANKEPTS